MSKIKIDEPCLYIFVVGFHHKKGCQIEYSYPELPRDSIDNSYQLPAQWKHLASLALPDGSHNYDEDFVYFHLTNEESNSTLFGISCYKQINAQDLNYIDNEITRATVQKSVCVLSRVPLYGALKIKLASLTGAYFDQKNFTKTQILVDGFKNLNNTFKTYDLSDYHIGISLSELVLKYEHKILILFKMLLLDLKVLFYILPLGQLSNTLIALVSLLPGIFDSDLKESSIGLNLKEDLSISLDDTFTEQSSTSPFVNVSVKTKQSKDSNYHPLILKKDDFDFNDLSGDSLPRDYFKKSKLDVSKENIPLQDDINNNNVSIESLTLEHDSNIKRRLSVSSVEYQPVDLLSIDFGFPLNFFSHSNLFHPYVSLHYLEYLSKSLLKSFKIGASNILFKSRLQNDLDVIIDNDKIEILNDRAKKLLQLTTADLRFADYLLKHVQISKESTTDSFEGSDEWIRLNFKWYLSALLASLIKTNDLDRSKSSSSFDDNWDLDSIQSSTSIFQKNLLDDFSYQFAIEFSQTEVYKKWLKTNKERLELQLNDKNSKAYHPFNGQLNVNDLKLKIMHTFSSSEQGRKINKALAEGSKIVTSASKTVFSGLNQAKSGLSSFFNTIQTKTSLLNSFK